MGVQPKLWPCLDFDNYWYRHRVGIDNVTIPVIIEVKRAPGSSALMSEKSP
jgi:hypothetical protein